MVALTLNDILEKYATPITIKFCHDFYDSDEKLATKKSSPAASNLLISSSLL